MIRSICSRCHPDDPVDDDCHICGRIGNPAAWGKVILPCGEYAELRASHERLREALAQFLETAWNSCDHLPTAAFQNADTAAREALAAAPPT